MNISIFASIGAQNLWDELILKNEIELLRQEFWENTNFRVASYDYKNPVFDIQNTNYFEYFPLWIRNPRNIFRNLKNYIVFLRTIFWSDIVVIWGGGIIYDSEIQSVKNPLDQWVFRTKVARFFRKKIYFYAIGIDIKDPENTKKLEKIFKKAWKTTLRDQKSYETLKNVGVSPSGYPIEIVNDPVMSENTLLQTPSSQPSPLEEKEQATNGQKNAASLSFKGERIQEWGDCVWGQILWVHQSKTLNLKDFDRYDFAWKRVWLALRSWYIGTSGKTEIERLLVAELCSYIESRWWTVTFLPHSFHPSDEQVNDYVFMSQFLTRDRDIYVNPQEVYTAYNHQMLDLVISQRLHSIILSYVYGIDQIVLSYSQKTDEVIKKLI